MKRKMERKGMVGSRLMVSIVILLMATLGITAALITTEIYLRCKGPSWGVIS